MIRDFNLLVSCPRMRESDACTEIWFLLGKIGDRELVVEKSEVSGLLVAKTKLEPFKAIAELRRLLKERPQEFRYILRVAPIEVVVPTRLEIIKKASLELSARIGESETFRVTVEKRHTSLSSKEVIEAVAEGIDRKVDLHRPDRIVLVEIVGGLTGVSVIKPDDVLSVAKEKP
ncbi:THUMP domain-containing protein [Candidatus Bathyarchaeota archaeon]|nr:THUMP domain-containing protein [Candidatus Bathyarchaeota archaeon]